MRKPKVVNDFMYFVNRPFARPENWKASELNMQRLNLAVNEGKFIVGQDEVKQIIEPS